MVQYYNVMCGVILNISRNDDGTRNDAASCRLMVILSPQAIMLITQLLLLGGGSRHHMLTENVTRVVVGPLARNRQAITQVLHTHWY